jgi:hypothetical protein
LAVTFVAGVATTGVGVEPRTGVLGPWSAAPLSFCAWSIFFFSLFQFY